MKLNRLLTRILALTLSLSMIAGIAFADNWYLENGSITVDTSTETQMVSQGGSAPQADSAPVITQSNPGTETASSITITGGGTANVTIENVNIKTDTGPGIDVQGSTTANITAQGKNSVNTNDSDSAAIHVSEGNLNLNTTEGSSVAAGGDIHKADNRCQNGAAIGSHSHQEMSGTITLSGKGSVNAESAYGAGIGSGFGAAMSGSITTGEGTVTTESFMGAGIGSGEQGKMSGSITTGSGAVTAKSNNGAAIGSARYGDMTGSIITGEGTVHASSPVGAAIGSGSMGQMSGSITTGSGDVLAEGSGGAGIGSGVGGDMTGSVITGSGTVTAKSYNGAGIGSGSGMTAFDNGNLGNVTGSITIGSGPVTATSTFGAGIGAGSHGTMKGTMNIAEDSRVTAESAQADAIGGGSEGKVDPNASLNVEKGARINGTKFDSKETIQGQQIPEKIPVKTPSAPSKPSAPASSAPAVSAPPAAHKSFYSQNLYWTLSDRNAVLCTESLEGGVLTLTADREEAQLHFTAYSLRQLQARGVETVVFRTAGLESSFALASVLDRGDLVLTHIDGRAELTLGGEISDLLK